MINQDTSENQVKMIYLGIGSNLGNRKKNIEKAKSKLFQNNIRILQVSSFYETISWPNPNYPKFLNIVLKINSDKTPCKLLKICKMIERNLGRTKSQKNSPRECDIDILDYDNTVVKDNIILPHPRMHRRNFVLFPLFEINKDWIHPKTKINIKKLLSSLSNKDISSIKQI